MSEGRLAGKAAMVVGSARGIGLATAKMLARDGAQVALADINLELAEHEAAEIRKSGATAIALRLDVAEEDQIAAGVEQVVAAFGALHVLHNNAVFSGADSDLDVVSMSAETWDATQRVNLRGPLRLACPRTS